MRKYKKGDWWPWTVLCFAAIGAIDFVFDVIRLVKWLI